MGDGDGDGASGRLPDGIEPIPSGEPEPVWRAWALATLPGLVRSARAAGIRGLGNGQWLSDATVEAAERVRPRDLATLHRHHGDRTDLEIAAILVRNASIGTGAIGGAVGALVTMQQAAPPVWITIPFELAAETAMVVGVELKLVAELHHLAGRPVEGGPTERAMLLTASWAEKRGVTATMLLGGGDLLARQTRDALARALRHRLTGRLGRNMASLIPMMAGAAAGAEINRRATRNLGHAMLDDLGLAADRGE